VKAFAFGVLGLRPVDYYDMTLAELSLMSKGYYEKVGHLRVLGFTMVRMWSGKDGPKTPEEYWPLPFDDKPAEVDDEQIKQILAEINGRRN
jgi:hypothetical protein